MAVRGQRCHTQGGEYWVFNDVGSMRLCDMRENDVPIDPRERRIGT